MTIRRYWIGSLGPFFFDDAEPVIDPDLIVTENQAGLVVEGTVVALQAPAAADEVVRLSDLSGTIEEALVTLEATAFFFARIY